MQLLANVSSQNNIAKNTKVISLSSPYSYLITYPFNKAWFPMAGKYLFWPWFGYPLHLSDIICFFFLPQYLTMLILIVIKVVSQPCIMQWSWYLYRCNVYQNWQLYVGMLIKTYKFLNKRIAMYIPQLYTHYILQKQ